MTSSRCAIKHAQTPIESLCKVFGISSLPRRTVNLPSQRTFSARRRAPLDVQQPSQGSLAQCKRTFTSTRASQAPRTIGQAKARHNLGPLTAKAAALFVATGVAGILYFREERARVERKKIADQTKGIGKPKVGGPFNLLDHNGNPYSNENLLGKYALVYFGFTHCPDICPDELDKMADMIDRVKAECGDVLTPIMISCDPNRDTPKVLKPYIKEFHSDLIGLTGTYDEVKKTCKEYRVYFSTPPQVKAGQDYLVDHSIYFYLMDPEGDFVEALGRNFTAEQAAQVMKDHIKDWTGPLDRKPRKIDP